MAEADQDPRAAVRHGGAKTAPTRIGEQNGTPEREHRITTGGSSLPRQISIGVWAGMASRTCSPALRRPPFGAAPYLLTARIHRPPG
jgi:hypothetical protein